MIDDKLNVRGRTAVITGAGQGIGLATVTAFLDAGMNVVGGDLTKTHATEGLVASLTQEHGSETEGIARFTEDLGMALARFGTADEVASALLYLASDLAAQITGSIIRMDGGTVPTV